MGCHCGPGRMAVLMSRPPFLTPLSIRGEGIRSPRLPGRLPWLKSFSLCGPVSVPGEAGSGLGSFVGLP